MRHPNEVTLTQQNKEELMQHAESLGPGHVKALKEQMDRQSFS